MDCLTSVCVLFSLDNANANGMMEKKNKKKNNITLINKRQWNDGHFFHGLKFSYNTCFCHFYFVANGFESVQDQ